MKSSKKSQRKEARISEFLVKRAATARFGKDWSADACFAKYQKAVGKGLLHLGWKVVVEQWLNFKKIERLAHTSKELAKGPSKTFGCWLFLLVDCEFLGSYISVQYIQYEDRSSFWGDPKTFEAMRGKAQVPELGRHLRPRKYTQDRYTLED